MGYFKFSILQFYFKTGKWAMFEIQPILDCLCGSLVITPFKGLNYFQILFFFNWKEIFEKHKMTIYCPNMFDLSNRPQSSKMTSFLRISNSNI